MIPQDVRTLLSAFADPEIAALASPRARYRATLDATAEEAKALVDEVAGRLSTPDPRVRRAMLGLLTWFEGRARDRASAVAALLRTDPDPAVRVAASRTLREIDPGYETAAKLMDAIESGPEIERQYIRCDLLRDLRVLAPHAVPLLDRLRAFLERARRAGDDDVVTAAWRAIHRIEQVGVRLLAGTTFDAGEDRVRSLAWSPTGAYVAAGCADRTLRLWNPEEAKPIASHVLPRYG